MREKIEKLFPELDEIQDRKLRDQVIAVWTEAMTRGGWTPEELERIPFTLLAGKIEMRFIEHVRSCVRMCLAVEQVLTAVWGERVPIHHDHLVAGVNEQYVYDNATGSRKSGKAQAEEGGYAWSPANRLIVTDKISYSLADHEILALDRTRYTEVAKERSKVVAERDELQKDVRGAYRSRYRLDKADPEFEKKRAEWTEKIDGFLAQIAFVEDNIDGEVFHGGVKEFFNYLRETMDLINKQDAAGFQVGENADQVAAFFKGRSRCVD